MNSLALLLHDLTFPFVDLPVWIAIFFSELKGNLIDVFSFLLLRLCDHIEHLWKKCFAHCFKFFQIFLNIIEIFLSSLFIFECLVKSYQNLFVSFVNAATSSPQLVQLLNSFLVGYNFFLFRDSLSSKTIILNVLGDELSMA